MLDTINVFRSFNLLNFPTLPEDLVLVVLFLSLPFTYNPLETILGIYHTILNIFLEELSDMFVHQFIP
jgi:hypothetical protein